MKRDRTRRAYHLLEIFQKSPSLEGFRTTRIFGGVVLTQHILRPSGMYDLRISYDESSRVVLAQFELDGRTAAKPDRSPREKKQDAKDFLCVLAVMKRAFDALILQHNVHLIIFHATFSEPKRMKLYSHYAQRIAHQYHGHVIETPLIDFMEYRITLPTSHEK